jgi:tetratricopeptide (TPR) repeat protein
MIFEEGETHFYTGSFLKAAELYKESYSFCKKPLLLKNAAVALEKAGRYAEARHMWEAFYYASPPKSSARKDAKEMMEKLDIILQAESRKPEAPVFAPPATQTVVVELKDNPKRSRLLWLGGGVGAAVLGGVLLSFLLTQNDDGIPDTTFGDQFIDF